MHYTTQGPRTVARICCVFTVCASALYVSAATLTSIADEKSASAALSAMTPGLTATEFAKVPGVIFARALADLPGKNLVVVALVFPPKPQEEPNAPMQCAAHRHPGSTYVYVTKGIMRLGIAGQPVQLVRAGESFYEPPRALHTGRKARVQRSRHRLLQSL